MSGGWVLVEERVRAIQAGVCRAVHPEHAVARVCKQVHITKTANANSRSSVSICSIFHSISLAILSNPMPSHQHPSPPQTTPTTNKKPTKTPLANQRRDSNRRSIKRENYPFPGSAARNSPAYIQARATPPRLALEVKKRRRAEDFSRLGIEQNSSRIASGSRSEIIACCKRSVGCV
jgi:hypothetical protein